MSNNYRFLRLPLLALILFISAETVVALRPASAPPLRFQRRYKYLQQDEGKDPFGVHWRNAPPQDYFYLVPAHLGGAVFMLVGNVVGWPPKIAYNLYNGDFSMEAFLPPIQFANKYFGIVGIYVVGGPFWCIKKALWDFPVWLFSPSDDLPPPEVVPTKKVVPDTEKEKAEKQSK